MIRLIGSGMCLGTGRNGHSPEQFINRNIDEVASRSETIPTAGNQWGRPSESDSVRVSTGGFSRQRFIRDLTTEARQIGLRSKSGIRSSLRRISKWLKLVPHRVVAVQRLSLAKRRSVRIPSYANPFDHPYARSARRSEHLRFMDSRGRAMSPETDMGQALIAGQRGVSIAIICLLSHEREQRERRRSGNRSFDLCSSSPGVASL